MIIEFIKEYDFDFTNEYGFLRWLKCVVKELGLKGEFINYIFCSDEYLWQINKDFLGHDTYTDIITFDNSVGNVLCADIFISIERVKDNAVKYNVSFLDELKRVMAHGLLHLSGLGDKSKEEQKAMRLAENRMIKLFHVER
jgi:rRNA maturation RNase YbeY